MKFTFTVHRDTWQNYQDMGKFAVADETQPDGFRQITLSEWHAEVKSAKGEVKVTLTPLPTEKE